MKDRRGGKRGAADPGGGGSLPDYLFAQGLRSHQAGQLAAAEEQYRQAIAIEPKHANSLYCLGLIALQTGRSAQAIANLQKAIALNDRAPDWHYNIAVAYQNEGRGAEAITHFRRTIALNPAHLPAKIQLANQHATAGELDQAAALYRGVIEAKPDQLDAQENLARILLAQDRPPDAFAILQRAFRIGTPPSMRHLFVQVAKQMRPAGDDPQFRELLLRALSETWGRPAELADISLRLIKAAAGLAAAIDRSAQAWPRRLPEGELFAGPGLAAATSDPLLLRLLVSTFVTDIEVERFLTNARRVLLDRALAADAAPADGFPVALAQQCFINEYAFDATEEEWEAATRLRDELDAALASGHPLRPDRIVAVAAYFPLHKLTNAAVLLQREPAGLAALLQQQIREPHEETALQTSIPRATPLDVTSTPVRDQYEENPYPRWIRVAPVAPRASYDEQMRIYCSRAPYRPMNKGGQLDILIARCGTGQTALAIGQQFPAARIMAVDISLASLAYATRKAREAGVRNVEFAQADLLKLRDTGRSFDVIESRGVLHHMEDPLEGWRALLAMLRPHGVMEIGLYSELARRHVVAGRALIAERGYRSDAGDIRRFRQDVMAIADDGLRQALAQGDFFSTSGCRDLLFHVRERRFSLPEIRDFLNRERLCMLGFNVPEAILQRYATRFPQDRSLTNLDLWHAFETEFPYTFRGMYQFWVQRTG